MGQAAAALDIEIDRVEIAFDLHREQRTRRVEAAIQHQAAAEVLPIGWQARIVGRGRRAFRIAQHLGEHRQRLRRIAGLFEQAGEIVQADENASRSFPGGSRACSRRSAATARSPRRCSESERPGQQPE
ncbi:MAG: hypothetical protein ABW187_00715, partial [Dokdonella sp.]